MRCRRIYDALGRLTNVNDLTNVRQWRYSYDATGNRLTQQAGNGAVSKYTYPTDSHHLLATGPVGAEVLRGYDAMGNTTTIGSGATAQAFHYDDTGRMDQLLDGAGHIKMQYATNALGQRVEKYLNGNTAATQYTIHDEAGQVLGEYDGNGQPQREVIWMDGLPVGVLTGANGNLSYIEPDQLGTPRVAIDAADNARNWSWDPVNDAFGVTQPIGTLELDLRFPGQVYDAESGVDYNYFRDYDRDSGRYVQSDPSGLRGGISTYAYAGGDPLNKIDPYGLDSIVTYQNLGLTVYFNNIDIPTNVWPSRSDVSSRSLPGAADPYQSSHVYPVDGPYRGNSTAYGPNDILKTDDPRGRWLHGGGTGLPNPLAPRQGWKPTLGCTRMQNEDIQQLVDHVREVQSEDPSRPITYERHDFTIPESIYNWLALIPPVIW